MSDLTRIDTDRTPPGAPILPGDTFDIYRHGREIQQAVVVILAVWRRDGWRLYCRI